MKAHNEINAGKYMLIAVFMAIFIKLTLPHSMMSGPTLFTIRGQEFWDNIGTLVAASCILVMGGLMIIFHIADKKHENKDK